MSEKSKNERKQDVSYPSWIDIPLVNEAIRNSGQSNSEVTKISVKSATSAGEHYASSMYRIIATLSTGDECSMLIKIPLSFENFPGFEFDSANEALALVLNRESDMLADLIPQMQALLEKVTPGCYPPFAPLCYKREDKTNGYIIMEDLCPLGFRLADKEKGLGLRHSILVFRTLARFHAASHALLKKNPNLEKKLNNVWRFTGSGFETHTKNGIQLLADTCRTWPGFEDYTPILEKYKESVMDTFYTVTDPKPGRFNAITHGDCWLNNMMFRYDEDGTPCDVRLVDFQMSHVGCPVTDLLYFLSASVSEDVSTHHQDLLFREYHFALQKTLADLGHEAPTLEEIVEDLNSFGAYSMINSFNGVPLMKSSHVMDLAKSFQGDSSGMKYLWERPIVKKWFQRTLPEYRKKGYLPEK